MMALPACFSHDRRLGIVALRFEEGDRLTPSNWQTMCSQMVTLGVRTQLHRAEHWVYGWSRHFEPVPKYRRVPFYHFILDDERGPHFVRAPMRYES